MGVIRIRSIQKQEWTVLPLPWIEKLAHQSRYCFPSLATTGRPTGFRTDGWTLSARQSHGLFTNTLSYFLSDRENHPVLGKWAKCQEPWMCWMVRRSRCPSSRRHCAMVVAEASSQEDSLQGAGEARVEEDEGTNPTTDAVECSLCFATAPRSGESLHQCTGERFERK